MDVIGMSISENIPLAAHSMYQARLRAVIEFATQPGNVDLDNIAEALPVEIVEMLKQLRFGDNGSGAVGEIFKHAVLHRGQLHTLAIAPDTAVGGIDFQIADLQHRKALPFATAHQSF